MSGECFKVSKVILCFFFLQAQYELVFEAVLAFLDSFDTYTNFQ